MEHHNQPPEVVKNLEELFPGLTLDEALQQQAILYQSLNVGCVAESSRSSDIESSVNVGHLTRNSSFPGNVNYDLALDEAVARSLQELDIEDEKIDHAVISESLRTASRNTEHAAAGTSSSVTIIEQPDAHQDDIDPDRMTYEELQSLGEAVGSEPQGLSTEEISSLPSYKIKTGGLFTKKIDAGECVICYTAFKNGDTAVALPCAHQYHKTCIEPWLVSKKTCPMCKEEVKLG